jgi:hypothetical protein
MRFAPLTADVKTTTISWPMRRKLRIDAPNLADLHAAVELAPRERREGSWSKLELIEMNERFCAAMRRAHPELAEPRSRLEPDAA